MWHKEPDSWIHIPKKNSVQQIHVRVCSNIKPRITRRGAGMEMCHLNQRQRSLSPQPPLAPGPSIQQRSEQQDRAPLRPQCHQREGENSVA
eukprot:gene10256-438_t